MKRTIPIISLLAVLVFLSGCISQEGTVEQRMLCLELSSQGFATVPSCASQQECFSALNANFYPETDETVFSYPEKQQFLDYKNKLALSWFYYNSALKNVKKIHDICLANNGFSDLPVQANELNFNLSKAFEGIDAANKSSFGLMLVEQSELEKQDVSLIREEAVFDDFVLLSENLNALQEKEQEAGSRLFVSKYFSLAEEFDALSKEHGFSAPAVKESSIFELAGQNAGAIAKRFGGNNFFVPMISQAVGGAINSAIDAAKLSGSVIALKNFPAFEFSVLFGKFAGTQGSLAVEFWGMQETISRHRATLVESNSEKENRISAMIAESEKKISEIDSGAYEGFGKNIIGELYSLLGQEKTVFSAQRFSLSEIGTMKEDAQSRLAEIKKELFSLQQKDFFGELSLGEKTNSLKQLLSELDELNKNIDFFNEETISGIKTLCSEQLSATESSIDETALPNNSPMQLFGLQAKAKYYIEQFSRAQETEKQLVYCRSAMETAKELELAKNDFEEYSASMEARTKECFTLLEKIFSAGSMETAAFLPQYRKLLEMAENNAEISPVEKACTEIKNGIAESISADSTANEAESSFAKAKSIISELKELKQHYAGQLEEIPAERLEQKLSRLETFFGPDSKIIIELAIGQLQEIKESAAALLDEATEEKRAALALYFQKFFEARVSRGAQATGSAILKISFQNPFGTGLDYPIAFRIPFSDKNARLSSFTENVKSAVVSGNFLLIDLYNVPEGNSFIEFETTIKASTMEEAEQSFLKQKKEIETLLLEKEKELFMLQDLNLFSEAAKLSLETANARRRIEKALLLGQEGDFDSAIMLLEIAKKEFSENNGMEELLIKERDLIMRAQNNISLKSEIAVLDANFLKAVSARDFNSAVSLLKEMKQKTVSLAKETDSNTESAVLEATRKIESYNKLLSKNGIAEKLGILRELLWGATDSELEIAGYVLPVSRSFPEKALLKLNGFDSVRLQKQLSEFDSLKKKKDFYGAFALAQSFSQELETKLKELEQLDSTAQNALSRIEEDAIIAVNSAKGFAKQSNDKAMQKQAGEAEKELGKKNFLKAIVLAKTMQSGILPEQTTGLSLLSLGNIPMAIIPLLGVIAVALIVKNRREKKEGQKLRLQKLFRNH